MAQQYSKDLLLYVKYPEDILKDKILTRKFAHLF